MKVWSFVKNINVNFNKTPCYLNEKIKIIASVCYKHYSYIVIILFVLLSLWRSELSDAVISDLCNLLTQNPSLDTLQ